MPRIKKTPVIDREALRRALYIAGEKHGGYYKAASAMGFGNDIIQNWRKSGGISLESVGILCKEIDKQVTKEEIMPDFDWSIFD